jgi:asparagine synthase (glutamine-hydrolysing)
MCGICGIVSREKDYPISTGALLAMRDSLVHRGPDDAGDYLRPGIALGSRRLSILDLSERAHMPMSTPDGRYRISYNGEVYNYQELRAQLEAQGYTFRSNCDTEVVLNLYAEYGPAMLARLNGMFAIAIWDEQERKLFLARDRLGVKPLYYASQGGCLYFASEEKALFAAGVRQEFNSESWEELLCFRYVAGERTPYIGVNRLLPGHYLLWNNDRVQIIRWWNLSERAREVPVTTNPVEWFQQTLDDAVRLRRISDVPVGVLLSGGLDSGSIAASLAQQVGSGLASFTVRFQEPRYDEGPLARQVAERWKLNHHELVVSPDQLLERLHHASRLNDEPLVHGNDLHLWAIAQYAKPLVTVLLSGEGGDETLGGYVRYRPLHYPALLKAVRPVLPQAISALGLNGRLSKLGRFLDLGSNDLFVLFNSCEVLPRDLYAVGMEPGSSLSYRQQVFAEAQDLYPNEPLRQAMYSDHHTFLCSILDRNDRMTMGASIECRVPFLDYRLVEGLAALPTASLLAGTQNKQLLRKAVGHRLPEPVLRHRKWGFAVPWDAYLRQIPELRSLVRRLPELDPVCDGPFSRKLMRDVTTKFLNGDETSGALVRQFLMIAVWYQACFKQAAPPERKALPHVETGSVQRRGTIETLVSA